MISSELKMVELQIIQELALFKKEKPEEYAELMEGIKGVYKDIMKLLIEVSEETGRI